MIYFLPQVVIVMVMASLHSAVLCMDNSKKIEDNVKKIKEILELDREINARKATLAKVNNAPLGTYHPRGLTLLNKGVNMEIDRFTEDRDTLIKEIAAKL